MGIKRIVDTAFWTDGKVDDFSPEDKYFMLYLLTNPFSTQLGIYEISVKQVAFHLGYSVDAVKVLLDRFETKYGIILFSPSTNEIAIKNFLRHSIIKGGAPVRDCLIKEIKRVKNKDLISQVFLHIKDCSNLNGTVKNIISDYEKQNGVLSYSNEKNNDNDNDNENENEVSYPVSCNDTLDDTLNDTSPVSLHPGSEPIKQKKGEYGHVLLSVEEEEKLIDEYGCILTAKAITFLDEYIETKKNYKSDNHYITIKKWVVNAVMEREPKNGAESGSFDTAEFFQAAMKRTQRTAADDEAIRKRAEELKSKIG